MNTLLSANRQRDFIVLASRRPHAWLYAIALLLSFVGLVALLSGSVASGIGYLIGAIPWVFVAFGLKTITLVGEHLRIRRLFSSVDVPLGDVLSVSWGDPYDQRSSAEADVFLTQDFGFGNPVSFVPSSLHALEEFREIIEARHAQSKTRADDA